MMTMFRRNDDNVSKKYAGLYTNLAPVDTHKRKALATDIDFPQSKTPHCAFNGSTSNFIIFDFRDIFRIFRTKSRRKKLGKPLLALESDCPQRTKKQKEKKRMVNGGVEPPTSRVHGLRFTAIPLGWLGFLRKKDKIDFYKIREYLH